MNRAEEMGLVLKHWKGSGLSLLAYAKREGLSYSKLQYWAAKLGARKVRQARPAIELTPVHVVSETPPKTGVSEPLAAWLPNGVALEIPAGFDQAELLRLVSALSTC